MVEPSVMKSFKRIGFYAGILFLCLTAGHYLAWFTPVGTLLSPTGWENAREQRELLWHLKQYSHFNGELFKGKVSRQRIDRFLNASDPYSDYLSKEEFENFEKETYQEYMGIGVEITRLKEGVTITKVFPGSPAFRSGFIPGDVILEVDRIRVDEETVSEVVDRITGPEDSSVAIKIFRPFEEQTRILVPIRGAVQFPSVSKVELLESRIGYLRIDEFARRTADEVEAALDKLEGQEMEALVLDLRNNPGGMLDAAVSVAGQFLQPGTPVVEIHTFQKKQPEVIRSRGGGTRKDLPVVVLLNRSSASASEIVAGSLKSLGRAVIVGERSYGKGSVQSIFALSNGEGLRMTTARFVFPDGTGVEDGVGLQPDIAVPLSYEEAYQLKLQEFHETLLNEDGFRSRFGMEVIQDRQLGEALNYLKGLSQRS